MMSERKRKKYCSAYGCPNKDDNPNINFFQLPKEYERRREWLLLLDREDLISKEDLKFTSYVVCSAHFDDSAIKIVKQLKCNSMPNKQLPNQSQDGTQTETGKEVETSKLPIAKITVSNQLSKFKEIMNVLTTNDKINKTFGKFFEWQNDIQKLQNGNRYNAEYIRFALNFHYSSPHAYRSLQTILQLPSKSTLSRFKISIPPILDNRVLESLDLKMRHLPDTARYCTMCVDVMELKGHLYYDTKIDEVIGFHNINGKKSVEIASYAYIIMLQGMYFEWKQPLAYALLGTENYNEDLDLWLNEVISRLSGIGIRIKAIISDQGSYFDNFAKQVKMVTVDKPYFMYDYSKIYYIFDVPQLIKCVRNNLQASDLSFNGEVVSWLYIKQLYDDQKGKKKKLIPKVTDSHIDVNKSNKMSVKYAVQIFSRTVAAALHTYIDMDRIPEEARPTANFIELMNHLFDVLNSNTIKTALRLTKSQDKILTDAQNMFATTKAIHGKSEKDNISHVLLIGNLQMSIQAIRMLYEDMKNEGFTYLFTRRLNHDNLKHFCNSIKQLSGPFGKPTSIQFQRAFSKLFVRNMLIDSPYPSCKLDICDLLIKAEEIINIKITSTPAQPLQSLPSAVCLDGETDYRMDLPEKNALIYVSGYILLKCYIKHNCPAIQKALKSGPTLRETNLFTEFESCNKTFGFYGGLKMPPKEFINNIQYLDTAFTRNFEKVIERDPGRQLYELLNAITPQILCSCFPVNYLLKLFIRMRIYLTLKQNNSHFKDCKKDIRKYIKVRNLQ